MKNVVFGRDSEFDVADVVGKVTIDVKNEQNEI